MKKRIAKKIAKNAQPYSRHQLRQAARRLTKHGRKFYGKVLRDLAHSVMKAAIDNAALEASREVAYFFQRRRRYPQGAGVKIEERTSHKQV
jgi:hypothetical protein